MKEVVLSINDNPSKKTRAGWLVVLPLGIILLMAVLWALLYSVYFANNSLIILLRNWYQETYWKVESRPTIQVQASDENGYYTYALWGIGAEVDLPKHIFYIGGYDKNKYAFKIKSYIYKPNVLGSNMKPFSTGKIYKVSWRDKRSLAQIKKDYMRDEVLPLNQDSPPGTLFAEYD